MNLYCRYLYPTETSMMVVTVLRHYKLVQIFIEKFRNHDINLQCGIYQNPNFFCQPEYYDKFPKNKIVVAL